MMKLGRRSNSFRGALPLDSTSDGKSPATVVWLVLHALCCLISLVLGFRFSRSVFFLFLSNSSTPSNTLYSLPALSVLEAPANGTVSSSRVVVGRHGILIRPWPHPNSTEVMQAHKIIEIVQREQRFQYGVKTPRTVIAITPTYVRTFQTLHLTGVMHSLMNAPYNVIWIIVEAGGITNETSSLLAKSGLRIIHIGFREKMPILWKHRHKLESKMRVHALRHVRDEKLDGIVMFADDSNMHSLELFDEIQKAKWVAAMSVGILAHSGGAEAKHMQLPVQGPACNSSNNLIGWHTFDPSPYLEKSARYVGDKAVVLPGKFEWAGFVLNSRLVWKDAEDKPEWVKDLDGIVEAGEDIDSPLSLLKDSSVVEPLGNCGRKVMLWWLRVEARADSKFPARWIIDPPLDVTVPAKRTPWPDAPPELPTTEKLISIQENTEKRTTKPRSRRRSSRKRKHVARNIDIQASSTRRSGEN
nr:probable beta-1,4-xylosyltransferase IRX14 [Ipomoea batatas]